MKEHTHTHTHTRVHTHTNTHTHIQTQRVMLLIHETHDIHPSEQTLPMPERKSETKSNKKYKCGKSEDENQNPN